jgi:anti-anti-sigma factor
MNARVYPGDVLVVELPPGMRVCGELEKILRLVESRDESDVMVDFRNVTILTSRSLTSLMHLRDLLRSRGRRLLLCSLDQAAKGVLSVTGLDRVFEIVEDRSTDITTREAQLDNAPVERAGNAVDRGRYPTDSV